MGIIDREFKLRIDQARARDRKEMVEINQAAAPKWYKLRHLDAVFVEKRVFTAFVGHIPAGILIWAKDFYSHYFIDLMVLHPKVRRHGTALTPLRVIGNFCLENARSSGTN